MPMGGGTSKTISTQELSPEQKKLLEGVIPVAQDYLKTPLKQFPESTIAGFNPLQQQGQQQILNAANGTVQELANTGTAGVSGATTAGLGAGTQALGQSALLGSTALPSMGMLLRDYAMGTPGRNLITSGALLNPNTNPVLAAQSEAALRPITQNLTDKVLPGIKADFVGNNMFGSSRQGIAEGQAIRDYLQQASDITTTLQNNNFNQGLGAMVSGLGTSTNALASGLGTAAGAGSTAAGTGLNTALQAIGLSPQLAQLAFLPGQATSAVGQQQQALDQAKLTEEANRFTTSQMMPFLQAQDVAQLAFGMGGGTATTQAKSPMPMDMGGMLGGLGSLLFGLALL